MTRNKQTPEWDDGRTIANMNVEGMPWYAPDDGIPKPESTRGDQLTKKQMRMYTMGALKAGLLIAGVFSLGLILFVLFCLHVWF